MHRNIPTKIAMLAIAIATAAPAAAFDPGVAVPKSTATAIRYDAGEISTNVEDGHGPAAISPADCRAKLRSFTSRNTMQPSRRRQALAACDADVASTPPAR